MDDERQIPVAEEQTLRISEPQKPVETEKTKEPRESAESVETPETPIATAVEEPSAQDAPQQQTACADLPAQEDVTVRLAEEFILLMEEFPQLQSPEQLPETVLETAAKTGISLLDAYLRYRWQQEKRVRAAAEQRAAAARQSAGSLSRGSIPGDPGPELFMKAFRSALR